MLLRNFKQPCNHCFLFFLLVCISDSVFSSKIQSFVKKPVETRVRLGDTATLECSVTPRHGDVQWIHEGTALGYDRQVPGRPRYSVKWTTNEDTEYHLQIINVTLEDEGLFSCQVAPIGDWDTKLEEKAKLIVLVGPAHGPEMMFNDESKNSNEIVHFKSSSEKPTKFTCTIRRTKPAAVIKWFLNDNLIDAKNITLGKSTETKQIVDGGHEDQTSVFELKQKTPLVYNNSVIKCQVYHEAFGIKTELQNMSISLRIVVVYAPSPPIITGYDPSIGIIAGSELKLNCSTKYSYPSPMLSWYRGDGLISKNYDTIEFEKRTESIYRIEKVTSKDNKAFFKCEAINQAMDQPISTNTTLNVLFGPEKLNMTGVFEVEIGKTISSICSTGPANPSPKLIFNFGGIDYEPSSLASTPTANDVAMGAFVVNGAFSHIVNKEHNNKELKCIVENKPANIQQIVTNIIKVLYPPDSLEIILKFTNGMLNEGTKVQIICKSRGGNPLPEIEWSMNSKKLSPVSSQSIIYTVDSTFDLVLGREHHNQSLICKSSNKVGSLQKDVSFNVSYLPSNVIISIVEPTLISTQPLNNVTVKAGTRVVFSCRSPNSNPQPVITWFKDSYPILFNSDEQQNISSSFINEKEYDTISYMSFIASSSDHLKEIRCDVKVRDLPRIMHGSMTLEVKFAPEIIKYPASVIDAVENGSFSLNLTARANPAPSYKCVASNKKTYPVVNGTLNFTTSRIDNSDFTCTISNSERNTEVTFRLNVKYEPIVKINSTQLITNEGSAIQVYCIIDANPLETSHIFWQSNNKSMANTDTKQYYSTKFLPPNLSVLTIMHARDIDDGEISCHVKNGIGGKTIKASTELRVKRTPTILVETSVLKAAVDSNMGYNTFFQCKAQAYPDVNFKWKNNNNEDIANSTKYVISNSKLDTQIFMSTLTIYSVSSNDYGSYACEAKNSLGPGQIAKAVLSGKHQPEQPKDFVVTNITKNSISLAWKKYFDGGEPQRFRVRFRKDSMDPTYKYIETDLDATSLILENLEPGSRYVINIQSFNKFGTEGFLREPLIVQTDYGFNEVNQMQVFTGNELPLTIILVICGSGTLFMLFNIAFIVYLIKKRKLKGEADSTTDTNETDAANTVEMFSPPPPYPDELNYQYDINSSSYEEENKPFVPHFHNSRTNSNLNLNHHLASNKYLKDLNDQLDYAIEYATPINQWPIEQTECDEDTYLSSLRQLDKNIAAAIAGVAPSCQPHKSTSRSSFNQNKRLSYINNHNQSNNVLNRPFVNSSNSFHQNLNNIPTFGENYIMGTRAFPYDRLGSQARLTSINSNKQLNNMPASNKVHVLNGIGNYRGNSTCKIYQDLDDTQTHNGEFKGHLV